MESSFPILSAILFVPVAGALLVAFMPRQGEDGLKWAALLTSAVSFLLSVVMMVQFNTHDDARLQFIEKVPWVPQLGISYSLGVDGISVVLIVLTTLLSVIAIGSSWTAIHERVKEYVIVLLLLETGMLGV